MSDNAGSGAQSMRFTIDEVLSGMLATVERDGFTDDPATLGELFKGLAEVGPLFAPFGALAGEPDFSATVDKALQTLVANGYLEHPPGRYLLTPDARARCITSKRTLFNAGHIRDLEAGARYFDEHIPA
jgi:hypothetical protein